MRRILLASLLLLSSLFPAAVNASRPADDSSNPTPVPRVSTGVVEPVLLNAPNVHLTPSMFGLINPSEETVVVSLNVDEKGKPQDVQIVKSANAMLDERVLEAVRQFHFTPAKLDDQPVPIDLTLNVVVKR
jgi:TonB family protein